MVAIVTGFALFCEDIRAEKLGTETLVGVLPNGILVPRMPFKFDKLGIYSRIQISRDWKGERISCQLRLPNGEIIEAGEINETDFDSSPEKNANSSDFFGFTIGSVRMIELAQAGTITVVLRIEDTDIGIGSLTTTIGSLAVVLDPDA